MVVSKCMVGVVSFPGSPQSGNEATVGSNHTLHRPQGGVHLRTHLTAAVRVCWCTVWSPWSTLTQCLGAQKMMVNYLVYTLMNGSSMSRSGLLWYIHRWMVKWSDLEKVNSSLLNLPEQPQTQSQHPIQLLTAVCPRPDCPACMGTDCQSIGRKSLGTRLAHSPSVGACTPESRYVLKCQLV